MNYYPFHVGDFAAHTAHLTWEEDIAYRRMLDVYYLHEKALPADKARVARLIRMPKSAAAIDAILSEFFVLSDDGWHNKRADQELTAMLAKQEQQSSKDAHETERMRRYRERRAEMFAALRERGIVPAWDVPMKELQRLFDETCNAPATDLQREQVQTCNADATAIPTPTPTPTPTPKKRNTPLTPQGGAVEVPDWIPAEPWSEFVAMRRAKGQRTPFTLGAAKGVIAQLDKFRAAGHDLADILRCSTVNGWADVYEPKAKPAGVGPRQLEGAL